MNKTFLAIALFSVLLTVGAGCALGAPKAPPAYLGDAEQYYAFSTSALPRGAEIGFRPAPPAPPTSSVSTAAAVDDPADNTTKNTVNQTTTTATGKPTAIIYYRTPTPEQYNAALSTHRDRGSYFQFVNCRTPVNNLKMKVGTRFMLDNRDPISHTFGMYNSEYTAPAYGYIILAAPNKGTYTITCDGVAATSITSQN